MSLFEIKNINKTILLKKTTGYKYSYRFMNTTTTKEKVSRSRPIYNSDDEIKQDNSNNEHEIKQNDSDDEDFNNDSDDEHLNVQQPEKGYKLLQSLNNIKAKIKNLHDKRFNIIKDDSAFKEMEEQKINNSNTTCDTYENTRHDVSKEEFSDPSIRTIHESAKALLTYADGLCQSRNIMLEKNEAMSKQYVQHMKAVNETAEQAKALGNYGYFKKSLVVSAGLLTVGYLVLQIVLKGQMPDFVGSVISGIFSSTSKEVINTTKDTSKDVLPSPSQTVELFLAHPVACSCIITATIFTVLGVRGGFKVASMVLRSVRR